MKKVVNVKTFKFDEFGRVIEEREESWEEEVPTASWIPWPMPYPSTTDGSICGGNCSCGDTQGKDGNI